MARNVQMNGHNGRRMSDTAKKASAASSQRRTASSARNGNGASGSPRRRMAAKEEVARKYGYTPREWDRINAAERRERRTEYKLMVMMIALLILTIGMVYSVYFVVFRSHDYKLELPFSVNSSYTAVASVPNTATAQSFAANLCVADTNINTDKLNITSLGAGLFDFTNLDTKYAKDIFITRSPASLTKIMTALVALKYGNLDDIVTVTETVKDIEYGSSVCDIKPGDQLTLKQLIYGLMIASGNDAAMMIAEHVGGSIEGFVQMMNQEALRVGATRTHFSNPHGLTSSDHYTCVYDIYLMFNEAMKYDIFLDIINRMNYYAEYRNEQGEPVAVTWESTNHYFTGEAQLPANVKVYGGKTGTTEDAGACLALLVKDNYGNPYLGVILHSNDKEILYVDMNQLLTLAA